MMKKTLAERMAEFAIGLKFEDLPAPVIHEVKRRVIDSLGCALGAWRADPCVFARQVASTFSAERGSTLWGTAHRSPPDWAAFANGCMVRYFDYNDTYLSKEPAHPSDNIPPAVAIAEAEAAPGRELIVAIALAYEIQCRLCDTSSIRARGWDHVTYGAFSSAIAAGRLMRLDAERMRHTIGIAGVASAALRQSRVGELSHWKGCAFANAARHGVYSALLARAGITGPAPIFEGEKGFEKLVSGPLDDFRLPTDCNQSRHREGADFMIVKTSIKFWPAEYHSQSAIEAALKLRTQIKNIDEIESVRIDSHGAAVDIIGSEPEKWRPTTRETADHSLPYIVAAALADGDISERQFTSERIADAKLLAFVQRVEVRRHEELSAAYPTAVGNILSIRLRNGRTLTERVDYPRGHARNPLTDAEVEAKFHALADPIVGADSGKAVCSAVWNLDQTEDLSGLLSLIRVKT
jgi:2-methylcitrate dehydratase